MGIMVWMVSIVVSFFLGILVSMASVTESNTLTCNNVFPPALVSASFSTGTGQGSATWRCAK